MSFRGIEESRTHVRKQVAGSIRFAQDDTKKKRRMGEKSAA